MSASASRSLTSLSTTSSRLNSVPRRSEPAYPPGGWVVPGHGKRKTKARNKRRREHNQAAFKLKISTAQASASHERTSPSMYVTPQRITELAAANRKLTDVIALTRVLNLAQVQPSTRHTSSPTETNKTQSTKAKAQDEFCSCHSQTILLRNGSSSRSLSDKRGQSRSTLTVRRNSVTGISQPSACTASS